MTEDQLQRKKQLLNSSLCMPYENDPWFRQWADCWVKYEGCTWEQFLEKSIVELAERVAAKEAQALSLLKAQSSPIPIDAKLMAQLPGGGTLAEMKERLRLMAFAEGSVRTEPQRTHYEWAIQEIEVMRIENVQHTAKIKDALYLLNWWLDPANRTFIESRYGAVRAKNYLTGLAVMRDTLVWLLELPDVDEQGQPIAEVFQKNLDGLRDIKRDLERWKHATPELN
jgi:hypothetical protein